MKNLSHILSRIFEVTLGGVLAFFGLLSAALGIGIGVEALRETMVLLVKRFWRII